MGSDVSASEVFPVHSVPRWFIFLDPEKTGFTTEGTGDTEEDGGEMTTEHLLDQEQRWTACLA